MLLLLAAAVGQGAIISPPKTAFQLREQPCWDPVREAIDNSGIEAAILQVMVNDTTVFTHAVGGVTEATQQPTLGFLAHGPFRLAKRHYAPASAGVC